MEFEVKRVLIGFEHGIFERWPGYQNENKPKECNSCNGKRLSNRYIQLHEFIQDAMLNLENFLAEPNEQIFDKDNPWSNGFSQKDINLLYKENLLQQFFYCPTPLELYKRNIRETIIGSYHEEVLINKQLEIEGLSRECNSCNGLGKTWASEWSKELDLIWKPTDPNEGISYQIWVWDYLDRSTSVSITNAYICKTDLLKELVSDEFSLRLDKAMEMFNPCPTKEYYLGRMIIEVQNA